MYMQRCSLILAAGLLYVIGSNSLAQSASDEIDSITALVETAVQFVGEEEYERALPMLEKIYDGDSLANLPPGTQADVQYYLAIALLETGKKDEAFEHFEELTASETATGRDWLGRARSALHDLDYDEAVRSLTVFAERWPDEFANTEHDDIISIVAGWRPFNTKWEPDSKLTRAVLDSGWVGGPPSEYSEAMKSFAVDSLENDMLQDAVRGVAAINHASVMIGMDADERFDPIKAVDPQVFDVPAAMSREIAAWQTYANANLDFLAPVILLADAYRRSNRPDLALSVVNEALEQSPETEDGEPRWVDSDRELHWLVDERSKALWDLGEFQAAIADLEFAQQFGAGGNQSLNLAERYIFVGDAASARALLPNPQTLTEYGNMRARLIHVMIGLLNQDEKQIERAWKAMRRASDEYLNLYQKALIYAGEFQEALTLFQDRLKDPDLRTQALLDAQQYAISERGLTPIQYQFVMAVRSFYVSREVQTAISEFGRYGSYGVGYLEVYR